MSNFFQLFFHCKFAPSSKRLSLQFYRKNKTGIERQNNNNDDDDGVMTTEDKDQKIMDKTMADIQHLQSNVDDDEDSNVHDVDEDPILDYRR